jgi:HSP20 family molecular chaperone IbpA
MFTTRKDAFDTLFDETMLDMLSTFKPKNETIKLDTDGDELIMSFDVPGFSKKDFKITVEDITLVIDGTTEDRKFFKSYKIQKNWDVKNTSAEVKNGILTLTIPKKEIKKDLVEISVK